MVVVGEGRGGEGRGGREAPGGKNEKMSKKKTKNNEKKGSPLTPIRICGGYDLGASATSPV